MEEGEITDSMMPRYGQLVKIFMRLSLIRVKVAVDLQRPILSKIILLHQIQDFNFILSFQKKNYFQNLKREQIRPKI